MITLVALTLALAAPAAPPAGNPSPARAVNPNVHRLFEREPALHAWALAAHDANADGWLTSFEAQAAADAFRALADADRDGQVSVGEYHRARDHLVARHNLAGALSPPSR